MKIRSEETGSTTDDWETPFYIKLYVGNEFGPYFDPCPLHATFDGLSIDWHEVNYINPPYTRKLKEAFIKKAYCESLKGNTCVMLIPATMETKIMHDIVFPNAEVRLIKGRVKFKGYNSYGEYVTNKAGQTGSMFVIFGPNVKPKIITVELEDEIK